MRPSTTVQLPTITTARLTLDAPTVEDFEGYAAIVTGPRGVGIGGPLSREEAWLDFSQMVAGWVLRGYGALSIRTRGERDYLGTVLVHHEFGDPEPELGALLTGAAEGQGIAFEAGAAMLDWAWRETTLRTLVSYMDPANHRALRATQRLGGTPTDGPADVVTYRYTRPA